MCTAPVHVAVDTRQHVLRPAVSGTFEQRVRLCIAGWCAVRSAHGAVEHPLALLYMWGRKMLDHFVRVKLRVIPAVLPLACTELTIAC